jgi:hypothetical protein
MAYLAIFKSHKLAKTSVFLTFSIFVINYKAYQINNTQYLGFLKAEAINKASNFEKAKKYIYVANLKRFKCYNFKLKP